PPLSLLLLFGLWALALIFGYALMHHGFHVRLEPPAESFLSRLYFSGVTFLTLGYGDIAPTDPGGRFIATAEAANGFLFLALVVSYLPVFYQAIQRREIAIARLDARAGSMPSGHELLYRYAGFGCLHRPEVLQEYEQWGAELLEAYLSYPVLCFYRSQHDEQSWLMTLTAILDACAIIESSCDGEQESVTVRELRMQARMTRAMLRHVIVDLAYILRLNPDFDSPPRLSEELFAFIHGDLEAAGIPMRDEAVAWPAMEAIRNEYEPYVKGIGNELLFALPAWGRSAGVRDNWEIAAWDGQSHRGGEPETSTPPARSS
ncbi:MAG: two pore domain potassium channel family protein, partial [Armatimonadota bacterium]